MEKILAYFDKKISLKEFDKKIPQLVDNFSKKTSVLIKVKIKKDLIEVMLIKNPNKNILERWVWDLNCD